MSAVSSEQKIAVSSGFAYQAKLFYASKRINRTIGHLQMRWSFNESNEIEIDSLVRVNATEPLVKYVDLRRLPVSEDRQEKKCRINKKEKRLEYVVKKGRKRQRCLDETLAETTTSLSSINTNTTKINSDYIESINRQLESVEAEFNNNFNYHTNNEDWSIIIDHNMFRGEGLKTINKLTKAFQVKLECGQFYNIPLRSFANIVNPIDWRCDKNDAKQPSYVITQPSTSRMNCTLSPNLDQANIVKHVEDIWSGSNIILVNSVAGSGKTTLLHFLKEHRNILYLATSKKLVAEGNAYGVKAQTIAKFLMDGFDWRFNEYLEVIDELLSGDSWEKTLHYDQFKPKDEYINLVFIDEVSLIHSTLLRELTNIVARICSVVMLVGDVNQLSAIGASEHDLYKCLSYVDRVWFIKQHVRTQDPELTKLLRTFEAGDHISRNSLKPLKKREIELTKIFNLDGSFKNFKFITKLNNNVLLLNRALVKLRNVLFDTDTHFEECYVYGKTEQLSENDITVTLQVGATYICLIDTCLPKGTVFELVRINREFDVTPGKQKIVKKKKTTVSSVQNKRQDKVISIDIKHADGTILTIVRAYHQYTLYGREHARIGFPLLLDLAISTHRCQGSTFTGNVFIELGDMSRSEGYVCISRATCLENLQIL